jgi:hypothetical protein
VLTFRDRGTSGTQLDIVRGTLPIGRLGKDVFSIGAGDVVSWSRTLCLDALPDGFRKHGTAGSRESAEADIERNWQAWLTSAGLLHGVQEYRDRGAEVRIIYNINP